MYLAVLAFVALQPPAVAGTSDPVPVQRPPAWTKVYESPPGLDRQHPITVALSPNARCVAIAHAGTVEIVNTSGQSLWQWNYASVSRYIVPSSLAVSNSCDAIAVVGIPGYRYTWLVRRKGGARALPTTSTPRSAAFDRRGERLVVGTAGSDVHLFSKDGDLKWKTTFEGWCCIVEHLAFSEDDQLVLVLGRGIGVLHADGTIAWSANEVGMVASRDLQTYVSWWEPPHGSGIGHVSAMDAAGQPLWLASKYSSLVGAVLSPTGDRIVAWVDLNQSPSEQEWLESEHPMALQVMNRGGDVVTTIPAKPGKLLALTADSKRVLLRTATGLQEVDFRGQVTFEIPMEIYERATVVVSSDSSGLLLVRDRDAYTVQWFDLTAGGLNPR